MSAVVPIFCCSCVFGLVGVFCLTLWYIPGTEWNRTANTTVATVFDHYTEEYWCTVCCSTARRRMLSTDEADTIDASFTTDINQDFNFASEAFADQDQDLELELSSDLAGPERDLLWSSDYYYSDYYYDPCDSCTVICGYYGGIEIEYFATPTGDDSPNTYRKSYTFESVDYDSTDQALREIRNDYPIGSTLNIWFDPDDPDDWRMDLYNATAALTWTIIFMICWCPIALSLGLGVLAVVVLFPYYCCKELWCPEDDRPARAAKAGSSKDASKVEMNPIQKFNFPVPPVEMNGQPNTPGDGAGPKVVYAHGTQAQMPIPMAAPITDYKTPDMPAPAYPSEAAPAYPSEAAPAYAYEQGVYYGEGVAPPAYPQPPVSAYDAPPQPPATAYDAPPQPPATAYDAPPQPPATAYDAPPPVAQYL